MKRPSRPWPRTKPFFSGLLQTLSNRIFSTTRPRKRFSRPSMQPAFGLPALPGFPGELRAGSPGSAAEKRPRSSCRRKRPGGFRDVRRGFAGRADSRCSGAQHGQRDIENVRAGFALPGLASSTGWAELGDLEPGSPRHVLISLQAALPTQAKGQALVTWQLGSTSLAAAFSMDALPRR